MTPTVLQRHSLKTRITVTMMAIFLATLWSLSYYVSQMLRKDMERLLGDQQFSTVSYLAAEINFQLTDRMDALKTVADAVSPVALDHAPAMQTLLEQRPIFQRLFNGGVIAYRLDGTAIAEVPLSAERIGVNYMDRDSISAALKKGESTIGRPVMGKKLMAPVFGMTAPILDPQGQVIGALSGVINLGAPNFLDKIAEGRYGKTGGYLLVAPQHRLVVTATDKRRIMDRIPDRGVNPVMDRFAQGYEGTAVVVHPLGLDALASAKGVPAAGWYVVASLPTAEAFAPVQTMRQRMLLATLLLTLLAGVVTWWMLKLQLAPLLAAASTLTSLSTSDQAPPPLPITRQDEIGQLIAGFNQLLAALAHREQALQQSEHRLSEILENVDAFIYLKDTQGRYLFANRPLRELFGVTMDGVVGQNDEKFFDTDTVAQLRHNDSLILKEGKALKIDETDLKLIDGRSLTALSNKLALRNGAGDIYALCGISTDITERKRAEEERRIAAIAFECQEGMIVTDANRVILRTNHSFTRIMGYTNEEVVGKTTAFMRSDRHPPAFYDAAWDTALRDGAWNAEVWHQRKNGEVFPQWLTSTAVKDERGAITHFVVTHMDITSEKQQEEKRLLNEAAQRKLLVREVHHRIKNNLQGITGLLRQFSEKHPDMADPINQAIGQVQGISVIHGLQGRSVTSSVRLCELTRAIASEIERLWQTPVAVDIPATWIPCVIAEKESVPMALMLHELIVNAVKHGGKAHGNVSITLRKGLDRHRVQVSIVNAGQLSVDGRPAVTLGSGLQLIAALMPRSGARLVREQHGDHVITLLELEPPVITVDLEELT